MGVAETMLDMENGGETRRACSALLPTGIVDFQWSDRMGFVFSSPGQEYEHVNHLLCVLDFWVTVDIRVNDLRETLMCIPMNVVAQRSY